jgi:hypothetical protein
MQVRSTWLLALLVASWCAAPAARAALLPFTGTLDIDIGFGAITAPVAGAGVARVNDSGGGGPLQALALPPGAFAASGLSAPITDPAAFPIAGVQLTLANDAGSFVPTGMGLGGTMPILGVAKVCLFAGCPEPPPANISVPLSVVGAGGSAAASFLINLTVLGGPWTTGTALLTFPFTPFVLTQMGFAHGPASLTSSAAAASGAVRLVTPVTVYTNLGVDQPSIFGFVTTTLHFVPEPGALLLGAVGLAGLTAAARSRSG